MATIDLLSVVFICHDRPNLTELCLRRFVEMIDVPHELILAYNGYDTEYIERLTAIADFDAIVTNPPPAKHCVSQLNDAFELCTGDLYMHLENDCYWDNPLAVRNAIHALETIPELDYVRMELEPFHQAQFKRIVDLGTDKIGIFKKQTDGGPPYQFSLQPHIRRERLPVNRRFPDHPIRNYHFERLIDDWWCEAGRVSGCLMGTNFRHIGMICGDGHFKPWLVAQMTCNKEDNKKRDALTPQDFIGFFNEFCDNAQYRELFRRYLNTNKNQMQIEIERCEDSSLGVIYNPSTWKNIKPDMTYVDVGAFNGETTIKTMEKHPKLWTLAIEPNPQSFQELLDKTRCFQERVRCVNSGCWSHQRNNVLYIKEDHLAESTMLLKNATNLHDIKIVVPVKPLDLIIEENNVGLVDLLKIDTEGAEHEVLAGFTKYRKGTQFHIEYHQNLGQVLEQLYLKDTQSITVYIGRGGSAGSIRGTF